MRKKLKVLKETKTGPSEARSKMQILLMLLRFYKYSK